jgi:hypothetical protein
MSVTDILDVYTCAEIVEHLVANHYDVVNSSDTYITYKIKSVEGIHEIPLRNGLLMVGDSNDLDDLFPEICTYKFKDGFITMRESEIVASSLPIAGRTVPSSMLYSFVNNLHNKEIILKMLD